MEPIVNTFVTVAPDTTARCASVPTARGENVPVHLFHYELLSKQPYQLTIQDLVFATHVRKLGLSAAEVKRRKQALWDELFSKSHACLRASALPKKFGWGVHHDAQGRIALVPMESDEYQRLASGKVAGVKVVPAIRTKRA